MNPALRGYILSLPLDVRRELCKAKCDAAYVVASHVDGWELHRVSPDVVPTWLCAVEAASATVFAVVPVSPVAIALHAAKLLGAFEATITVDTGGGYTYANATTSPSEGEEVPYQFADVESDPTGHRAAMALLQKVMEAKAS